MRSILLLLLLSQSLFAATPSIEEAKSFYERLLSAESIYEALDVPRGAHQKKLDKAIKEVRKKYHESKAIGQAEEVAKLFGEITKRVIELESKQEQGNAKKAEYVSPETRIQEALERASFYESPITQLEMAEILPELTDKSLGIENSVGKIQLELERVLSGRDTSIEAEKFVESIINNLSPENRRALELWLVSELNQLDLRFSGQVVEGQRVGVLRAQTYALLVKDLIKRESIKSETISMLLQGIQFGLSSELKAAESLEALRVFISLQRDLYVRYVDLKVDFTKLNTEGFSKQVNEVVESTSRWSKLESLASEYLEAKLQEMGVKALYDSKVVNSLEKLSVLVLAENESLRKIDLEAARTGNVEGQKRSSADYIFEIPFFRTLDRVKAHKDLRNNVSSILTQSSVKSSIQGLDHWKSKGEAPLCRFINWTRRNL